MERPAVTRGNPNSFLSSLVEFCVDSATTCFSQGADKLCVPIGLCALSALILLLSCLLIVYQRCRFRRGNPGETVTSFYSLLGNLCSTVGAVLSRQLHLQVTLKIIVLFIFLQAVISLIITSDPSSADNAQPSSTTSFMRRLVPLCGS
uniref:Uncharacterized protein n=1 Tax=Larimichthys crocea TaxID=215358 RepID=A0A0F8AHU1_LARCR